MIELTNEDAFAIADQLAFLQDLLYEEVRWAEKHKEQEFLESSQDRMDEVDRLIEVLTNTDYERVD
jgi:two-component sensor histidine kinase